MKTFFPAVAILLVALAAGLAFESVYRVTARDRPPDPILNRSGAADTDAPASRNPLALRMVDSGGVGIPVDDAWGVDYSHDRRAFRNVILEKPPYIDAGAFAAVERDWQAYIDRMLNYGNNTIVVPLLAELIDFERLNIYESDRVFLERHAAIRRHFGSLFEWADRRGMQVFLDSDMLALTPPLARRLRALAPATGPASIDATRPEVWAIYRQGLEELFDRLPSVKGVVIRFGEGGGLYGTAGWPYQSEVAIRTAPALRAMLEGLLPAFEARNRTLVLRSWTVGVGAIGRLHTDPAVYESVLGSIDSPALVVSTKFTAGDFFSYLPLNPTLAEGRHRRVVELQAKPEFEGFSAFPNFLGAEHGRALRALTTANPKIIGTYVLSQFGGPLRAGPRLLYPLHGFWLWTDANVFVASRLASNPSADVDGLTREWARMRFGQDEGVVEAIADMLARTREAVLRGFYIRAFAEREVRVPGLEVPPLMWIFEWDMVGGWHSLLSLVYSASRETAVEAIEEGQAAARAVREARQQLRTALASRSDRVCTQSCDQVLRSLEYQETLFDALAAWRRAFLGYYQWIETGGDEAWSHWLEGRAQFDATVERHSIAFGSDYDFPAFDFTSASRAIATAHAGTLARGAAASALAALVLALCLQSPFGTLLRATTLMPWRIDRAGRSASMFAAAFVLLLIGLVAMLLSGLTTPLPALLAVLVAIVAATAFDAITMRGIESRKRASVLVAPLAPQLPGIAVLLALMAYFGPLAFWYEFWTSSVFRLVFVTVVLAVPMWTVFVMLAWSSRVSWYRRIGGTLAAAGAVTVTLAALLPDWVVTLRSFDRPLNFAPATATMLFALDTYVGVELHVAPVSWLVGTLLVAGGYTLSWLPLTGTNRSSELLDRQLDALPAKATGNRLDDPAQH